MNNGTNKFIDFFNNLAKDANGAFNSEKAKVLKKRFLIIGIVIISIGIILFATTPFLMFKEFNNFKESSIDSFNDTGNSNVFSMPDEFNYEKPKEHKSLMPYMFICGLLGVLMFGVGGIIIKLSLSAYAVGISSKYVHDNTHHCPKCGDLISEEEKFCNKCGFNLEDNFTCLECGMKNESMDNYCKNCGNKLR